MKTRILVVGGLVLLCVLPAMILLVSWLVNPPETDPNDPSGPLIRILIAGTWAAVVVAPLVPALVLVALAATTRDLLGQAVVVVGGLVFGLGVAMLLGPVPHLVAALIAAIVNWRFFDHEPPLSARRANGR